MIFFILVCVSQAGDNEEKKREKQARMTKMESLMKELEGLLKHDGNKVFFINSSVLPSFFTAIYMLKKTAYRSLLFLSFCRIFFYDTSNWFLLPEV